MSILERYFLFHPTVFFSTQRTSIFFSPLSINLFFYTYLYFFPIFLETSLCAYFAVSTSLFPSNAGPATTKFSSPSTLKNAVDVVTSSS